jgi:hypothetical protein
MPITIERGITIGAGIRIGATSINTGVVVAGLNLYLDGKQTSSYPGSGSTWYDLTSFGNNATLYNSPTYDGTSLVFSGAGTAPAPGTVGSVQYGQVPNGVYFNGDFTINTWIKISAYNNWQRIIDFGNGAGNNSVLLASTYGTSGYPGFYVGNGGNSTQFQSTAQLSYNTWYNVGATMSGTTGTIYVNGSAAGSQTMGYTAANVTRQYCYIGRSEWAGDGMFQGGIGAILIYNRALSASEMLTNYTALRTGYGV